MRLSENQRVSRSLTVKAVTMLTDTALRNLKPKSQIYKVFDRDGMYVVVSTAGTITFRYDYRLNGRRETLTLGRYGPAGMSLAMARERLLGAKRSVDQGLSPVLKKQRAERRLTAARTFGEMRERWLVDRTGSISSRFQRNLHGFLRALCLFNKVYFHGIAH